MKPHELSPISGCPQCSNAGPLTMNRLALGNRIEDHSSAGHIKRANIKKNQKPYFLVQTQIYFLA